MKNLFYLLFALPLLLGCDKDNEDDINTLSTDYWSFEVTINGETHKAEKYGLDQYNLASCNVLSNGEWAVSLGINDPSSNSYVSG